MKKKGEEKGGGKKESLCRVSALCPAPTMTFDLTNGLCNRQRMCNTRVITADVKSSQVLCNNGLWMVCGSNTPPDEGGQLPTSTCVHRSHLWRAHLASLMSQPQSSKCPDRHLYSTCFLSTVLRVVQAYSAGRSAQSRSFRPTETSRQLRKTSTPFFAYNGMRPWTPVMFFPTEVTPAHRPIKLKDPLSSKKHYVAFVHHPWQGKQRLEDFGSLERHST